MATVLSGTSGALYYTPAGTSVTTLVATAFPATGSNITVGSYLGFKVNDPVTLAYPAGATTTNAIAAGNYFVKTYNASTGVMTISSTAGGAAATATANTFFMMFPLCLGVNVADCHSPYRKGDLAPTSRFSARQATPCRCDMRHARICT